ncbi:MAG: hypothetical protein CM15mP8_2490 [Methanobacteriota archaeon]|nr:MAG: hypothetical protein CM15mP8_2490 [Euryarchaeota archaeon]
MRASQVDPEDEENGCRNDGTSDDENILGKKSDSHFFLRDSSPC